MRTERHSFTSTWVDVRDPSRTGRKPPNQLMPVTHRPSLAMPKVQPVSPPSPSTITVIMPHPPTIRGRNRHSLPGPDVRVPPAKMAHGVHERRPTNADKPRRTTVNAQLNVTPTKLVLRQGVWQPLEKPSQRTKNQHGTPRQSKEPTPPGEQQWIPPPAKAPSSQRGAYAQGTVSNHSYLKLPGLEATQRPTGVCELATMCDDVIELYEFDRKKDRIGDGSTAVVFKASRRSDGAIHALKVVNTKGFDKISTKLLRSEVLIMSRVDHPSLVQLYDVIETKDEVIMAMQLLRGMELFDAIAGWDTFCEKNAVEVVVAVAEGVKYLNDKLGVAHRDLKPENIVYKNADNTQPMITDLGFATLKSATTDGLMKTACGTPTFVAPEVIGCRGYGFECDMWSLGVILYILLCGYPPFYQDPPEVYKKIGRCEYDFPEEDWAIVSPAAIDLVKKLLTIDTRKRLNPSQCLSHPWVTAGKARASSQKLPTDRRISHRKVTTLASLRFAELLALSDDCPSNMGATDPSESQETQRNNRKNRQESSSFSVT